MTELALEVQDGDITITLPGTKRIASRDDPRGLRLAEFLAQAWRLANNKARELGWIV